MHNIVAYFNISDSIKTFLYNYKYSNQIRKQNKI